MAELIQRFQPGTNPSPVLDLFVNDETKTGQKSTTTWGQSIAPITRSSVNFAKPMYISNDSFVSLLQLVSDVRFEPWLSVYALDFENYMQTATQNNIVLPLPFTTASGIYVKLCSFTMVSFNVTAPLIAESINVQLFALMGLTSNLADGVYSSRFVINITNNSTGTIYSAIIPFLSAMDFWDYVKNNMPDIIPGPTSLFGTMQIIATSGPTILFPYITATTAYSFAIINFNSPGQMGTYVLSQSNPLIAVANTVNVNVADSPSIRMFLSYSGLSFYTLSYFVPGTTNQSPSLAYAMNTPDYWEKWRNVYVYTSLQAPGIIGNQNVIQPFVYNLINTPAYSDQSTFAFQAPSGATFQLQSKWTGVQRSVASSNSNFSNVDVQIANNKGEYYPIFSGNIVLQLSFFDATSDRKVIFSDPTIVH